MFSSSLFCLFFQLLLYMQVTMETKMKLRRLFCMHDQIRIFSPKTFRKLSRFFKSCYKIMVLYLNFIGDITQYVISVQELRHTSTLEMVSVNYICHPVDYFDLYKTLTKWCPLIQENILKFRNVFHGTVSNAFHGTVSNLSFFYFLSLSYPEPCWKAETLLYEFLPTKQCHKLLSLCFMLHIP